MVCNYNCMENCEKCDFPDKVFEELSRRENGVYQLTRPNFELAYYERLEEDLRDSKIIDSDK